MKKIIIALLVLSSATLIWGFPQTVKAFCVNNVTSNSCSSGNNGQVCSGTGSTNSYCQDTASGQNPLTGSNGYIIKAADFIAYAAGVAAVIVIIIGSIRFVISGGDTKSVNDARNMIIYALVGLVAIAIADLIIRFVTGVA
ncbi:MAG TPA: hypothetical protein VMR18_03945 [Candidatus Saccharimonadales bacterium]|jgi:hypothetical protein|nr:hypothetical protein [Candidatus Saccharimonadales bacterium]